MIDYTKNLYAETEEEALRFTKKMVSAFFDISNFSFECNDNEHSYRPHFNVRVCNSYGWAIMSFFFYRTEKYSKFEPSKVMPN